MPRRPSQYLDGVDGGSPPASGPDNASHPSKHTAQGHENLLTNEDREYFGTPTGAGARRAPNGRGGENFSINGFYHFGALQEGRFVYAFFKHLPRCFALRFDAFRPLRPLKAEMRFTLDFIGRNSCHGWWR